MAMMRTGRPRWRIKNETFNTLKNPGHHCEHHYGHGHQPRSTGFTYRMMPAFLINLIQQWCCGLF